MFCWDCWRLMRKYYSPYFGGEIHECDKCHLTIKRRTNEHQKNRYEIYKSRTSEQGHPIEPYTKQVAEKNPPKEKRSKQSSKSKAEVVERSITRSIFG